MINPYGKPIKLPLRADDHRIWKAPPASSTDPTTWSSYAKANRSPVGHGLGFVLNGDGIICIDLDHCVVDGKLDADAAAFVKRFPKTYVEISPSGTGLHIWGFGTVIKGRKFMHGDLSVEIYGTGRYLTFTGTPFVKAPFADLSEGLIRLDR